MSDMAVSKPFEKNFYQPTEYTVGVPEPEVREYRRKNEIQILTPGCDFKPVFRFEDAGFRPEQTQRLLEAGFTAPSAIQAQSWPIIMSGKNFIGIATTGSGKTLAFLLPALVHIAAQRRLNPGEGPICLVLAPTRELAEQIRNEGRKFCMGVRISAIYGGSPKRMQLQELGGRVEILVACPGRLIDFLKDRRLTIGRVTFFVLDEADRMLDFGFKPQIEEINEYIRKDRQVCFFSATWPKELRHLAYSLCEDQPVHVQIGSSELSAAKSVKQHVKIVSEEEKYNEVINLLRDLEQRGTNAGIMIFCETKRSCDYFARELRRQQFNCVCIHGDKEQEERRYVLEEFKTGRANILVATDVASRGLDIKDVKVVINIDMPMQIEDYVHRIGRTGRANATGESYTFFTDKNKSLCKALVGVLQDAGQEVPVELSSMIRTAPQYNSRFGRSRYGGGGFGRGHGGPYGNRGGAPEKFR
uniref:RNA helicase n=1 Tax=Dermatophagoides pteronyssinus TaxID=6956 RepID=A0A6P6Y4D5_DERPT|nr:DEAD-box ATP-dependent RNA helicase 20-like [Dermatophagoides pteronyssinus]